MLMTITPTKKRPINTDAATGPDKPERARYSFAVGSILYNDEKICNWFLVRYSDAKVARLDNVP